MDKSRLKQHTDAEEGLNKIETKDYDAEVEMGRAKGRVGSFDLPRKNKGSDQTENDHASHKEMRRKFKDFPGIEHDESKADTETEDARSGQNRPLFAVPFDHRKRERPVGFARAPDRHAEPRVMEEHQQND